MHLTFERNTNSCEDLYWGTVGDRYVLHTHANSAWEEVPIRETGTNSMRGRQKGREVELSREEFRNNLQTVKVAVEEGSDKRDQGPIQWRSRKT